MPASNNPFYVAPPDVMQSLMAFDQSYNAARKDANENQIKAGRLEAMNTLQSGGDVKGALAKLIGIGDTKGADAIATYANNQATQQYHTQSLAQQGEYQRAQIANMEDQRKLAREQETRIAAEPKAVGVGQDLIIPRGPEAGKVVYKGSSGLDDAATEVTARQIIGGDLSGLTNIGRGTQGDAKLTAIRNKAANILINENGMSPAEAAAHLSQKLQAFKAESSGKLQEQRTLGQMEAKMGAAGFEAEGAIKLALPVIDKVPRTNFLPFNKLIVGYQNQTLSPDQAELFTRLQAIKNAYQAVMQRGANVNTVYAGHRADELLDSAANPEVLKRVLSTMQNEIDMARNAPQRMRDYYKKEYGPKGLEPSQNISEQGDITGMQVTNVPSKGPVDWKTYFGAKP